MKNVLFGIILSLAIPAFADQCAYNSADIANRGALLLQKGSKILSLCEPCGEKVEAAKVKVVRTSKAATPKNDSSKTYKEVVINGRGIDLAYTFIEVSPDKYVNVAKIVGCPATDVSEVIEDIY